MNQTKSSNIHPVDKSTGNDPHMSISMRLYKALCLHGVFFQSWEAGALGDLGSARVNNLSFTSKAFYQITNLAGEFRRRIHFQSRI